MEERATVRNGVVGSVFRFCLLGQVSVSRDGMEVPVRAGKQRALLVGLLLDGGRAVPVERLAALLWDERRPPSAGANIRTHLAALRSVLADARRAAGSRLERRRPGYAVVVEPSELDLYGFRTLVDEGRLALAEGCWHRAADRLCRALALWHGPVAAEDVPRSDALASRLDVLDELRLCVTEDLAQARLAEDRHGALVPDLRAAVAEQPLRERRWEQLVLALYRSGDVHGALAAFAAARRTLDEELGVEPGQQLRRLYLAVLDRDPALSGPEPVAGRPPTVALATATTAGPPAPRELPAGVSDLVGRSAELAGVEEALSASPEPALVVLHGGGGAGVSAVALHAAHRLAPRFPDGQLYADLFDRAAGRPVPADEVLRRFLRALGVPARAVPQDAREVAARYRSLLAGRRLLVVLDHAVSEAQLRALLPASPGCAALVTSWLPLVALDGASLVPVGPLRTDQAVALLARWCDPAALAAERVDARWLVHSCGRGALGIRIAGARLAAGGGPARPGPIHRGGLVGALAAELADERRRLDGLAVGDLSIRASLRAHHEAVLAATGDQSMIQLLGLLALLRVPLVEARFAAAVGGVDVPAAAAALERLAGAHLCVPVGATRFRLPPLVRLHAAELLGEQVPPKARTAAVRRALAHLIGVAGPAVDQVSGAGDVDRIGAGLTALVRRAAAG